MVNEVLPTLDTHPLLDAISYQVFSSIVNRRMNDAFDVVKLSQYQDMKLPLSH